MKFECLLYEIKDRIATLTLNRPDRLNALGGTLREDLYAAIIDAGADAGIDVIVVTDAGRAFFTGGDVKSMSEKDQAGQASTSDERMAPVRDRCVLAMRDC